MEDNMSKPKDNIIEVAFTREMLIKQCLDKALKTVMDLENILILARDKEGDLCMYHSIDSRAEMVDVLEECKFALYSGEFFDA
jgi:hypothetical protein